VLSDLLSGRIDLRVVFQSTLYRYGMKLFQAGEGGIRRAGTSKHWVWSVLSVAIFTGRQLAKAMTLDASLQVIPVIIPTVAISTLKIPLSNPLEQILDIMTIRLHQCWTSLPSVDRATAFRRLSGKLCFTRIV
jgi:hypothetical protein